MSKKRKKPLSIRAEQVNPWVWAQIVAQAQQNPEPVKIAPVVRRAVAVGFSEADRLAGLPLSGNTAGLRRPVSIALSWLFPRVNLPIWKPWLTQRTRTTGMCSYGLNIPKNRR